MFFLEDVNYSCSVVKAFWARSSSGGETYLTNTDVFVNARLAEHNRCKSAESEQKRSYLIYKIPEDIKVRSLY